MGGSCVIQGTFPIKLLKVITVITHNNHSFIKYYLVVITRGNTERGGGGSCQAKKGWGWKPAHTGEGSSAPGAPPTEAAHQSGGQARLAPAPALTQLWPQPWYKIVAKVTIRAEEIFTAHAWTPFCVQIVCTIVRQVLCVNTIKVARGRQLTQSKSH